MAVHTTVTATIRSTTSSAAAAVNVFTDPVVSASLVHQILVVLEGKNVVTMNAFTGQVVLVGIVLLILVVLHTKVAVTSNVFTDQGVSVRLVRLILIVLAGKGVVVLNVLTVQVVSGATVRKVTIAVTLNYVVTTNAKMIARGHPVLKTLTAVLGFIPVVMELANPKMTIVLIPRVLPI